MTVELLARRKPDLDGGRPNYSIHAGAQLVGSIYLHYANSEKEQWGWAINTVLTDARIGGPLHGYAASFADARAKLRGAFDTWLSWARTIEPGDPKHPVLARQLVAIGRAAPEG